MVPRRKVQGRVRLTNSDRRFSIQVYRWFPSILNVLTIFRPETLMWRHRGGFRCYWRWKSLRMKMSVDSILFASARPRFATRTRRRFERRREAVVADATGATIPSIDLECQFTYINSAVGNEGGYILTFLLSESKNTSSCSLEKRTRSVVRHGDAWPNWDVNASGGLEA